MNLARPIASVFNWLASRKRFLFIGLFISIIGDVSSLVTLLFFLAAPEKLALPLMIGYFLEFCGQMFILCALYSTWFLTRHRGQVMFILGLSFGLTAIPLGWYLFGIISVNELTMIIPPFSLDVGARYLVLSILIISAISILSYFQGKLLFQRLNYMTNSTFLFHRQDIRILIVADGMYFFTLVTIILAAITGILYDVRFLRILFGALFLYHLGYWLHLGKEGINSAFIDSLIIEQAISSGDIAHATYFFGRRGPELASFWAPKLDTLLDKKSVLDFFLELGVKLMTQAGYGTDYGSGTIFLEIKIPNKWNVLFLTSWGKIKNKELTDDRFSEQPYVAFCLLVKPQFSFFLVERLDHWRKFVNSLFQENHIDELTTEQMNDSLLDFISSILLLN